MSVRAQLQEMYNPAMIATQAVTGLRAGQIAAATAPSTGSASFNLAMTVPSWVVAGMPVYDVTSGQLLGVVSSTSGVGVTMAANSAHAGSIGDVIQFGLTPPDLAAGAAAAADLQGLVAVCILKLNEVAALVSYMSSDAITSSEDSTLNTLLGTIATAL